jgi:TolA-binding protein
MTKSDNTSNAVIRSGIVSAVSGLGFVWGLAGLKQVLLRGFFGLLLFGGLLASLHADPAEERAFGAAREAFTASLYQRAETDFREFIRNFPGSPLIPEAVLLQAQCALEQSNYAGALQLLATNRALVGARKDEVAFWTAEIQMRQGNYDSAASLFDHAALEFPGSPRRSEALVKEATARAKLNQWQAIIDLLGATNGLFQSMARTNGSDNSSLDGFLLLTEALLARTNLAAAEATLLPLGRRSLDPTNAWSWHYFVCRLRVAQGHTQEALDNTTNLMSLAARATLPRLQAESVAFKAELLEKLGRNDEALAAYTNNLSSVTPADRQRQALLKTTQLRLSQNRIVEAVQHLDRFLVQYPQAASADLARLTLGELHLRQYLEGLATNALPADSTNSVTNHLEQAVNCFQTVASNFPNSLLLGTNFLDLGWTFWLQGRIPESAQAFLEAVQRLPPGDRRAWAHFKLGDAQSRQAQFISAITNYKAVIEEAGAAPDVTTNLLEPALYQIVRAGLAATDLASASNAMARIVGSYPKGFHTERAVLLFGQYFGKQGGAVDARQLLEDFLKKDSGAALRPQIELAIARTYEQQRLWGDAARHYEFWLDRFTNDPARPSAAYCRAQALWYAGDETNAFISFTNFAALYPSNELSLEARWHIADFYYNTGSFGAAENEFQLIALNWPGSEQHWEALMMAGRAAVGRQAWNDAADYFNKKLAADTNCPAHLRFQALFACADTLISQTSTNKLEDYRKAKEYFEVICQQYSTNRLAVLACGRKADCLLQLAQSGADLVLAADGFQQILTNTTPGLTTVLTRSIAKVGLGVILEKLAADPAARDASTLRNQALDQYLDVLFGKIIGPEEVADEYWTGRAGLEAIRLASETQAWQKVINICDALGAKLPQMTARLSKRRQEAIDNLNRQAVSTAKSM